MIILDARKEEEKKEEEERLWPVGGQKEDTEEEKVYGSSVLKNRTYIQNKTVRKLSGSSAGMKSLYFL